MNNSFSGYLTKCHLLRAQESKYLNAKFNWMHNRTEISVSLTLIWHVLNIQMNKRSSDLLAHLRVSQPTNITP